MGDNDIRKVDDDQMKPGVTPAEMWQCCAEDHGRDDNIDNNTDSSDDVDEDGTEHAGDGDTDTGHVISHLECY